MKRLSILPSFLLCLTVMYGCTQDSPQAGPGSPATPEEQSVSGMTPEAVMAIELDARRFMEAYAENIRNHDGAAVAERYHPSGTFFKGSLMDAASIHASYTEGWEGPSAFEWRNLRFEVLGPDAVLASATGLWGRGDIDRTMNVLYASVLTRQDGEWRIRVEDETVVEE